MGRLPDAAALQRSMWTAILVLSVAPVAASGSCSRADGACSVTEQDSSSQETDGVRSNSLLQTHSVRGLLKADVADEPEDFVEETLASLEAPCDGGPCSGKYSVLDSDMQSRSASNTWGSHLQKARADVVSTSSSTSMRSYVAYASYLRRAVDKLALSRNASNQELDTLIDQFIAAHTPSQDHCPAELMESKHQLNDLHQHIVDLANLVKALEQQMQEDEQKRNKANDDIKKAKEQHDEAKSANADAKEEARRFLAKLRAEMAQMRQIAQPSVSMNISARTVTSLLQEPPASMAEEKTAQEMVAKTKAASTELLTCLEEETAAMPENRNRASLVQVHQDVVERRHLAAAKASLGELASPNCSVNQSTPVTVGNLTAALLAPADIANETYRSYHCSHVDSNYGGTIWLHCENGVLSADSRGCIKFPNHAQCQSQRIALQETYVKAYVALARLIDQYEKKVVDTAAEEAAKKKYNDAADPKKKEAEDKADDITKKTKQLQDLRARLTDAWNAEKKLQNHVTALGQECKLLGNTTQYLTDVRDAIHALEACPGLQRAEFHIPLYTGAWANFTLDPTKDDVQNDLLMDAACVTKFGAGTRAAEVAEMEGHSIEAAPWNNTAVMQLVGKCPNCEGESLDGGLSVTGHGRVCWYPGKPLDLAHRKGDCYQNIKAVMCVTDRGDVRKLAGFATMPPTTAANATAAPSP